MIFSDLPRPGGSSLARVLDGTKTRTTRPKTPTPTGDRGVFKGWQPCRCVVGRTYAVQAGRGKSEVARILILAVQSWDWSRPMDDPEAHAHAEGFASYADFRDELTRLYPHDGAKRNGSVWIIDFKLIAACGTSERGHILRDRVPLKQLTLLPEAS